jgi:tRNA-2-methylthio-N6-dimethylallyladenosine synthase
MNELDSELMVGALERRGLQRIEDEMEADLLIYNTCAIRDLAERKVMGKLGLLGKTSQREAIIGVTGCMANAKKSKIFENLPHVDFVLGTNNIHELNAVIDEVVRTGRQAIRVDDRFKEELLYEEAKRDDPVKAHVSIIRGCDKCCTYCVVPFTRGREVSRHPDSIVAECRQLAAKGYKEVTLLGQNVNSYGKDEPAWATLFHDLLYQLDKIEGLERIRFMTSHPIDITRELMEAIRDLPSMCEFVHFPFQAGANRILRKMHRIYTIEHYLEKVAMLKEFVPDVALGTDVIVGFPTETEEEFLETFRIMEEVEFSVAFLFAFSMRKGTPAMRWKDDVPEEIKQDRLQRLLRLHDRTVLKQRQGLVGDTVEVLVDRRANVEKNLLKGRTRCWKNVLFAGPDDLIGTLQMVKIHSFSSQTLFGELVVPVTNRLQLVG